MKVQELTRYQVCVIFRNTVNFRPQLVGQNWTSPDIEIECRCQAARLHVEGAPTCVGGERMRVSTLGFLGPGNVGCSQPSGPFVFLCYVYLLVLWGGSNPPEVKLQWPLEVCLLRFFRLNI